MAKFVVPPHGSGQILLRCYRCHTLYAPDPNVHPYNDWKNFEPCPVCNAGCNDYHQMIPLWKYKLIRFFRGRQKGEKE